MASLARPISAQSARTEEKTIGRQHSRASDGSDWADDELKINKGIMPGNKLRVSLVSTTGSSGSRFSDVSFDDDDDNNEDDDDNDDAASCGTPVYRMPCPMFEESENGDEPEMRPRGRSRRVSFDVPEEEEKVVIGRRPRSVEVHDLEALVVPVKEEQVVISRRPRSAEVHDLEALVSSTRA